MHINDVWYYIYTIQPDSIENNECTYKRRYAMPVNLIESTIVLFAFINVTITKEGENVCTSRRGEPRTTDV